jgi:CheY-like chemotaxis protein
MARTPTVRTEAAGGVDAIRLAAKVPFDVLIIDIRMPDIDGPSVAKEIREGSGPNDLAPSFAAAARHLKRTPASVGAEG